MKFTKFSPDLVSELLVHFADNEAFPSLKDMPSISRGDVQNMLVELAEQVRELGGKEPLMRKSQLSQKDLTPNTTRAIAKLSPKEEEQLFKSFRIS